MNREEIKEIARESMLETLKTNLDSAMIFTYVKSLEDRIKKAIEYIEENSYKYTQISKDLKEKEINDLLDILRGKDNEEN